MLWRVVVGVLGGLITLIGVVALIGPGPGWLILFVGLGVLASEFAWADRALIKAKVAAFRARDRALAPEVRRTLYAASFLFVVVLGGGLWFWVR
jgi:uncharacterized protein (TIGR02611 family)